MNIVASTCILTVLNCTVYYCRKKQKYKDFFLLLFYYYSFSLYSS